MTSAAKALSKPHYVFRPGQLLRRRRVTSPLTLPWGLPLAYEPTGELGESLARTGIYDLAVSEVLWRLLGPGDAAIDAGANIGYMTSIMVRRVGSSGRIDSFEPHPETFRSLTRNVGCWDGPVALHNVALAQAGGTVELASGADPDGNRIKASTSSSGGGERVSVPAVALDDVVRHPVRLLKIDIEGGELAALRGAEQLLGRVEHVVYEDHERQPSPVTSLLRLAGFSVYLLQEGFLGPRAYGDITRARTLGWDAPSLVATRAPEQVAARLGPRGWRCLRG